MKKLALLLGAFLVFAAGCGIDEAFKDDEPDLVSKIGILSEQSANDSVAGTHLLNDGVSDTPVRSLSVNLSSDNFLENKVQIIGFLNQDDGVFEVTGISVVEALHELEEDPELETYKNTDFGVQLAVFSNYEVVETDSMLQFTAPDESTFQIFQESFQYEPVITPEGEEESSAILDYAAQTYSETKNSENSIRKIGATPLDALYVDDIAAESYHLYRNGLIYTIKLDYNVDTELETKNNFAEMLAEFKFTGFTVEGEGFDEEDEEDDEGEEGSEEEVEVSTDEIVVPDMKFATFESLPHLFAGNYPASWYYAGSSGDADVIRHYGFSDESVTENNELISLDIISGDIPSGTEVDGDGKVLTVLQSGSTYTVYTSFENKTFRISGDSEYEDIMLYMASGLFAIEEEE